MSALLRGGPVCQGNTLEGPYAGGQDEYQEKLPGRGNAHEDSERKSRGWQHRRRRVQAERRAGGALG